MKKHCFENLIDELQPMLLVIQGVTRWDIECLGLKRFLFFDKPFVVFKGKDIHIKIFKLKKKEYMARFSGVVSDSEFYRSERWLKVNPNAIDREILLEIIGYSYKTVFAELSEIQKMFMTAAID